MRGYKANMIPGGVTPTINVSQYDNDYAVTVTLIEGAEIYTPPAGATIRVEGTKPDGHGFEYPCTYQGNVVTMPIYTQMTAVAGRFPIELVVYQSGLRVGSCNIIFAVEKAPLGEDTDISETVLPDIIDAAQASAEAAEAWAVGQRDGVDVPSTDETYHNNAKYYAESVSETVEAAEASAEDAAASAATATAAQQSASASATAAAGSASQAANSAQSANSSAIDADAAKTAAQTAAAQASTDANTASDAASSATSSASTATAAQTSASASATTATNAETNALAYRDAAAASAASAETAAQELQSQLIHDTASGAVASFPDGADNLPVDSLVAEITPVQDLHGQSNPYPAGGGKNLIPYPYSRQSGTYNGVTITVNDDGTLLLNGTATSTIYWDLKGGADAVPMTAGSYILHRPSTTAVTGLTITAAKDGNFWNTASQENANLTLESDASVSWYILISNGTTLSNVKVYPMFEKGTTASDWSPYSNICPISGRTGLTVTRAGKNLFNMSTLFRVNNNVFRSGFFYIPAGNYIFSRPTADDNLYTWYVRGVETEAYSPFTNLVSGDGISVSGSFSLTTGTLAYIEFYSNTGISDGAIKDIQIEAGNTATPYTPYVAPTEIPITWETEAGTIYGGTLDVVSGVLTVTHASYDLAALDWSSSAPDAHIFRGFYPTVNPPKETSGLVAADAISSEYTVKAYSPLSAADDGKFGLGAGKFIIIDHRYSAIADFVTHIADVQMVAKLATPQTYQLTPTEVRTILGGNTIYTDAGDVSVEYIADTKLYIDNKIAELQALVLEN